MEAGRGFLLLHWLCLWSFKFWSKNSKTLQSYQIWRNSLKILSWYFSTYIWQWFDVVSLSRLSITRSALKIPSTVYIISVIFQINSLRMKFSNEKCLFNLEGEPFLCTWRHLTMSLLVYMKMLFQLINYCCERATFQCQILKLP